MTWTDCWHCGWNLNGVACRARPGPYHDDMRAMQQRENLREQRAHNHPYTQLANGRLYVRRT